MTSYSQRSLRDKLDIKPGMRIYLHEVPADMLNDLDDDTTVVHD